MLEAVKEVYRTGCGKEWEWRLEQDWQHADPEPAWGCRFVATPLSRRSSSQGQNVQIRVRLYKVLLAILDLATEQEQSLEPFTRLGVLPLAIQLTLENLEQQDFTSGEVTLRFTPDDLKLELSGETKSLVSWSDLRRPPMPEIAARLEKALSDARQWRPRIGFR